MTFDERYDEIMSFIGSDPLVAHNAQFDMNVLRKSAEYYGIKLRRYLSIQLLPRALEYHRLRLGRLACLASALTERLWVTSHSLVKI